MTRIAPVLLVVFLILPGRFALAQNTRNVNVLAYYAADNSLDGQPMIDMQNVLRFFPMFVQRDDIDTVIVTVYYHGNNYTRFADRQEDGRYWEILLPPFEMGQAIQRIDVEVRMPMPTKFPATSGATTKTNGEKLLGLVQSARTPGAADRPARGSMTEEIPPTFGPETAQQDIQIYDENTPQPRVRILFRNYKTTIRYLPALDPGERLGVFRTRYIPFAVVGGELRRPVSENVNAIFEVGLNFGDAIVPGDDFVVPEFSGRRLGVAFAITDKLFSDSAEVMALALTYDFNSYGSIGVGANFPATRQMESYVSFGINRKAFERLLRELEKLFR